MTRLPGGDTNLNERGGRELDAVERLPVTGGGGETVSGDELYEQELEGGSEGRISPSAKCRFISAKCRFIPPPSAVLYPPSAVLCYHQCVTSCHQGQNKGTGSVTSP